jgi:hypothetical protein
MNTKIYAKVYIFYIKSSYLISSFTPDRNVCGIVGYNQRKKVPFLPERRVQYTIIIIV